MSLANDKKPTSPAVSQNPPSDDGKKNPEAKNEATDADKKTSGDKETSGETDKKTSGNEENKNSGAPSQAIPNPDAPVVVPPTKTQKILKKLKKPTKKATKPLKYVMRKVISSKGKHVSVYCNIVKVFLSFEKMVILIKRWSTSKLAFSNAKVVASVKFL